MEIERKFLLASEPESLVSSPSSSLRQGYLVVCPDGETRVRSEDDSRTLTVKSGSGRSRAECEIALTAEQFDALWPATESRRVEKRRYRVALGEHTAEIDIYEGALAGLRVVEVEFESEADADSFVPPPWFGREVTDERGYKNAALALHGWPAEPVA